ncbi:MAG: nucleotidyl transferase AbiEii/AbiGii toxin family protein [Coriobacteriia bacterium]|nr:nucleotidyl transferase AbiEii/AbiGii toxin family protein [Coriobacteriia bacterium]
MPASVHARLLNRAKEQGESFDQVLQYYAIERFLYRLSLTEWGERFVVKGATMLRAWGTPLGRPTRDIDFLGAVDNSTIAVERVVGDCLAVEYPEDGLVFDSEIETSEINVADRYPGVRAVVRGHLDGGRFKLQLDVGIDDAVAPDPEWVDYPTLLDFEAPRILVYQPTTAIAEKFETMVSKGFTNSRMRDFYDIWLLSTVHTYYGAELAAALRATFAHRGTLLPISGPSALTATFYGNPGVQAMWRAFLSGGRIDAPTDLSVVCEAIRVFIMPPAAAVAAGEDFLLTWEPSTGWS